MSSLQPFLTSIQIIFNAKQLQELSEKLEEVSDADNTLHIGTSLTHKPKM